VYCYIILKCASIDGCEMKCRYMSINVSSLLPPYVTFSSSPRDHPSVTRLRAPSKFPRFTTGTKNTKPFSPMPSPTIRPHICYFIVCIYCMCFSSIYSTVYISFGVWLLLPINVQYICICNLADNMRTYLSISTCLGSRKKTCH